jgi:hypothetical protein
MVVISESFGAGVGIIMDKLKLKKHLIKKRILTDALDWSIFFPFVFPLLPFLMNDIFCIEIFDSFLVLPLLFIGYFGLITKITNGYTIGGLITSTRIINLSQKKISVVQYSKRKLSATGAYFGFHFSGVAIMNGIGQYNYDKKYNTAVLPNDVSIQSLDKSITYRYDYFFDVWPIYVKYGFGSILFIATIFVIIDILIKGLALIIH